MSKLILVDGKEFGELSFIDEPEFKGKNSRGELSEIKMFGFRYLDNGKGRPRISPVVEQLLLEDF